MRALAIRAWLIFIYFMRSHSRLLELVALTLVLLLAAYLRLANVADNPAWYTDEATHLNIAQNLMQGRVQYLAINQSTLLFAKLPLFEMSLAVWMKFFGTGMLTLRAFTGLLGVVSVALLYGVVRWTGGGRRLALLAALLLAIYPPAVLYSRFGFSYNLLTPLLWLTYLGLWRYVDQTKRRRWLVLASLAIGIGAVSDMWMFSLIIPALIVIAVRHWRDALWSLPLMLLPFGLYAAIELITVTRAFLFDLNFTLLRLNQIPLSDQLSTLANNYAVLLSQDSWLVLGLAGLLLLRPIQSQRLSLLLLIGPTVLLGRTVALYSLSFYYMLPLLPFVALGLAALIDRGAASIPQLLSARLPRRLRFGLYAVLSIVVTAPVAGSTVSLLNQVQTSFNTAIDPFLIEPTAARQVAEFVNQHTQTADVVIASPGVAWLLQTNAADFQMSIAATGRATPHLPADMPADRFAFNPDYTRARMVIIDNLWRNWAVWNVAGVSDMLRDVETWPRVFKAGAIEVYCNSRITACPVR